MILFKNNILKKNVYDKEKQKKEDIYIIDYPDFETFYKIFEQENLQKNKQK